MSADSDSLVLSKREPDDGYSYNRSSHPSQETVEWQLCKLYNVPYDEPRGGCCLSSSGMNAISNTLQALLNTGEYGMIAYGSELYCDTPRTIDFWAKQYRVQTRAIPVQSSAEMLATMEQLKGQAIILLVEACSNPSGHVFDFGLLPKLRQTCRRLTVVVDNTWLTSIICNPLDLGADIVVTSLTKYYSAGSCIAGAILTRNARFAKDILQLVHQTGMHVSPHHCDLILQALPTLEERVRKASDVTVQLLLDSPPCMQQISHPFLPNHPSHALAQRYFTKGVYPSVLQSRRALIFGVKMHCAPVKTCSKNYPSVGGKLSHLVRASMHRQFFCSRL